MEIGTLLNLPVKIESDGFKNEEGKFFYRIKLINQINGLELAVFESESLIFAWGNPGGFYTKSQYFDYFKKVEK